MAPFHGDLLNDLFSAKFAVGDDTFSEENRRRTKNSAGKKVENEIMMPFFRSTPR